MDEKSEQLFVNATIGDDNVAVRMILNPSIHSWSPGWTAAFVSLPPTFSSLHLPSRDDPYTIQLIREGREDIHPDFVPSSANFGMIGIGHRSALVDEFESVSILKNGTGNTAVMVSGQPNELDGFVASCVSGSIMRIRLGLSRDTFRARISPGDEQLIEYRMAPYPFGILTLPQPLVESMMLNIFTNYSGLSTSLPHGLPNLTVSIDNVGTLVMFPEDYIYRNVQNGELYFRTSPQTVDYQHFFDPSVLPNMNVRFTSRFIEICDAA